MTDLWLSGAIFVSTEIYIWLFARSRYRWTVVVPVLLVFVLWRYQGQTLRSLGLSFKSFVESFRTLAWLWLATVALFFALGWQILFHTPYIFYRGCSYFVWCTVQQILFQSVIYAPLQKRLAPAYAALIAGLAFATLHLPNLILVSGTLVWGFAACLIFERSKSVLGLALLQVMLSSMLLWLAPYSLTHGFRVGPFY